MSQRLAACVILGCVLAVIWDAVRWLLEPRVLEGFVNGYLTGFAFCALLFWYWDMKKPG